MEFRSLPGLTPYEVARKLQLELVEQRIRDAIPDTVLFLEHESVVTRGKGLQWTGTPRPKHMPLVCDLPQNIAFYDSERGGDLTYHGPGQLVIYPIIKLHDRSVVEYLRKLEWTLIEELREINLCASSHEHSTGVWIDDINKLCKYKIASIGIAIKRWVTYHGMAINVMNSLEPFRLISPCGLHADVMTRLVDWVPDLVKKTEDWRSVIEPRMEKRFKKKFPEPGVPKTI